MVERGGRVIATTVPNVKRAVVMPHIEERILPSTTIFTDEWQVYDVLGAKGWTHHRIRHREKIYVSGNVHTNTIEGFFGLTKSGIRGTYHAVSKRWLQGYLNEYAWRYNHRADATAQFRSLLLRSARG
jgi:transposase-like protein